MAENKTHEVSEEEVRLISKLASIELTPNDTQTFTKELSKILGFVQQLAEVDTSQVDGAIGEAHTARMRADEMTDGGYRDDLLSNAPVARHGYFIVPKVIE